MTAAVATSVPRERGTTEKLLSSVNGIKDVVDLADTACAWVPYLDVADKTKAIAGRVQSDLAPISQGLSIFGFVEGINNVRRDVIDFFTKDKPDAAKSLFTNTLVTVNKGSETAMFFNTAKLAPLREWMKTAASFFWGTVTILSGMDLMDAVTEIDSLKEQMQTEDDPVLKNLAEHKITIAYIKIAKSVATIALGAIILTSLAFAAVTSYVLFSPVVQLSLTTAYFALHFTEFYYKDYVDYWGRTA